jgi:hypothetical protein
LSENTLLTWFRHYPTSPWLITGGRHSLMRLILSMTSFISWPWAIQ